MTFPSGRILRQLPWFLLILAGVAARLWQLDVVPEPNGDEAYYGIQSYRISRGHVPALRTSTGNLIDPFIPLIQVPLLWASPPTNWILRLPSALLGIGTIALTYLLGKRVLDQTTAGIAAVLFAIFPIAIIFNRSGCEYGQTPFFSMLALLCAFSGRRWSTFLAFTACLIVHPTTLFLAPIVLPVLVIRLAQDPSRDRKTRLWQVGQTISLWGFCLGAFALYTKSRPTSSAYYSLLYRPMNWWSYLEGFGGFLTGSIGFSLSPVARSRVTQIASWAAIAALSSLLATGTRTLIAERRWERLGLISGVLISVGILHVAAGSAVWSVLTHRYGSYLIAPVVVMIACLATRLLDAGHRSVGFWVSKATAAAIACGLLCGLTVNYFGPLAQDSSQHPASASPRRAGAMRRALAAIEQDLGDSLNNHPTEKRMIVASDWWVWRPIEYLALSQQKLVTCAYDGLYAPPDVRPRLVQDQLFANGYCVAFFGTDLDSIVRTSISPCFLNRQIISDYPGVARLTLSRLRREVPVPGDYDGDGTVDAAVYSVDSADWRITTAAGLEIRRQFGTPRTDLPVPADYDGDGVTDLAVYEHGTGRWRILFASGREQSLDFAAPSVGIPVAGDYDGDGIVDPAVYRRDSGHWVFPRGSWGGPAVQFGTPGLDQPVPGDYDGDGTTDLAVYRASTAEWIMLRSKAGRLKQTFGDRFLDDPVPDDYDRDGRTDLATYRCDTKTIRIDGKSDAIAARATLNRASTERTLRR
jgi:4-amino-4-deoxy-L-arabinose transferase-like glycosyltransferase